MRTTIPTSSTRPAGAWTCISRCAWPDYPALDVWKEKLEGKGVSVEGPIDHGIFRSIYFHDPNGYRLEFCAKDEQAARATAAESAMTRENLRKWNEWKASRMQSAAE